MYIGTDIVKICRIEKLIQNGIPQKIYTVKEAQYIDSKALRAQTAAGIFAAKEAVLKLLATGIRVPLTDVCISHTQDGKPMVSLCGKCGETALEMGISSIEISISHDGDYATATAIAKADEELAFFKRALLKFDDAPKDAITPVFASSMLPKRKKETHKGDYGRLFILAGSKGLTGAAIMSANSALKCGAGLITLGCAKELNQIFELSLTEVMTKPFESCNGFITMADFENITDSINSADIALIGPGLGRSADLTALVSQIVLKSQTPLILDADALFAVSQNIEILNERSCPVIMTPHIGEFSRLRGLDADEILKNPRQYGQEFASKYNVVLILKSHRTIVCTPDGLSENILGNPGMAKGGSGDVLAGAVASFAAQGMSIGDAAKLGVYIHSLAGDMASFRFGEYSATPTDTINYIPYAIKYSSEGD